MLLRCTMGSAFPRHLQVFENAVYIFFTHAFDVGDTIKFEGNRYEVRSITLQYVSFERVDGADVTVPTSELRSSRVHNMSRYWSAACAQ
jgi:small-conductance mechanosensitive channel